MPPISLARMKRVTTNSASRSLVQRESGSINNNVGASGAIVLTLPASLPGSEFHFACEVAQSLTIAVQTGDTMALPSTGVQGSASKGLVSNTITSFVHLTCVVAGKWDVAGYSGTWTAQP